MPFSIRPSILFFLTGLLWLTDLPAQAETSVFVATYF